MQTNLSEYSWANYRLVQSVSQIRFEWIFNELSQFGRWSDVTLQDGKWQTLRVALTCRLFHTSLTLLVWSPMHPEIIYQWTLALPHFIRCIPSRLFHYKTSHRDIFHLCRWRTSQSIKFTFTSRFLRSSSITATKLRQSRQLSQSISNSDASLTTVYKLHIGVHYKITCKITTIKTFELF